MRVMGEKLSEGRVARWSKKDEKRIEGRAPAGRPVKAGAPLGVTPVPAVAPAVVVPSPPAETLVAVGLPPAAAARVRETRMGFWPAMVSWGVAVSCVPVALVSVVWESGTGGRDGGSTGGDASAGSWGPLEGVVDGSGRAETLDCGAFETAVELWFRVVCWPGLLLRLLSRDDSLATRAGCGGAAAGDDAVDGED